MAAGDLLRLPGLQERPLRAHRGPRGGHRLRQGGPAARQGSRRRLGFQRAAHVRGRVVGAEAGGKAPARFPAPAGRDRHPHGTASGTGWSLPLGGISALAGEPQRAGAQPLLWRVPGWLAEDARHRDRAGGDSAQFVAEIQQAILDLLAQAPEAETLPDCLPEILRLLRRQIANLRKGRVPAVKLVVGQKLSKTLEEYRDPSPAARAAVQLAAVGKTVKQGQRVRFVYTLGKPGVHAWDLPNPPDPRSVDVQRYITLLLRRCQQRAPAAGRKRSHAARLGVGQGELSRPAGGGDEGKGAALDGGEEMAGAGTGKCLTVGVGRYILLPNS